MPHFADQLENENARDTYRDSLADPALVERLRDVPARNRMAVAFNEQSYDPSRPPELNSWDRVSVENSVFESYAQDASPERRTDLEALQAFNVADRTMQGSYGADQDRTMAAAQEAKEVSSVRLYDAMQRDPAFQEVVPEHLRDEITRVRGQVYEHERDMHERFPGEFPEPRPMEPLKGRDDQALTQQEPPMPERGEEGLDLHSRDRSDDTDLVIDEPELDQRQDQAQTPDLSDDLTEERDRAAEPLADRINREFDREAQSVEDFLNEKSSPSQDELAPQEERDAARTSQDRQSFGRNNLESLVSRGYGQQYVADKEWYQQRQEALRAEQQPTRDPRDTDRDFNRGGRGDL